MKWKARLTYKTEDNVKKSDISYPETLNELLIDYLAPIVASHGEESIIEIHIFKAKEDN